MVHVKPAVKTTIIAKFLEDKNAEKVMRLISRKSNAKIIRALSKSKNGLPSGLLAQKAKLEITLVANNLAGLRKAKIVTTKRDGRKRINSLCLN